MNTSRILLLISLLPLALLMCSCSYLTPLINSPRYADSQAIPELASHNQLIINHNSQQYHYEMVLESRQGITHIMLMADFGRPILSYTLKNSELTIESQAFSSLPLSASQLFVNLQQVFWPKQSLLKIHNPDYSLAEFEPNQRKFFYKKQLDSIIVYDDPCLWGGTTTLKNKTDGYSLQIKTVLTYSSISVSNNDFNCKL